MSEYGSSFVDGAAPRTGARQSTKYQEAADDDSRHRRVPSNRNCGSFNFSELAFCWVRAKEMKVGVKVGLTGAPLDARFLAAEMDDRTRRSHSRTPSHTHSLARSLTQPDDNQRRGAAEMVDNPRALPQPLA